MPQPMLMMSTLLNTTPVSTLTWTHTHRESREKGHGSGRQDWRALTELSKGLDEYTLLNVHLRSVDGPFSVKMVPLCSHGH